MQLAEAIAIMAHSFDNTDAPPDAKKSHYAYVIPI